MKKIGISIVLIIILSLSAIFVFFYVFLPSMTNHGETLTVPELEGTSIEDIDQNLVARKLRYEVNADSGFNAEYPANTILQQQPEAGAKVKENRKIYITLNASTPPEVKMPNLIDGSVKNAQVVLKSYGLEVGELKYVPDLAKNSVLEQWAKGREVEPGEMLAKGTRIDLVVGDGLGNTLFDTPNLIGKELEDAEVTVKGSSLNVGSIIYEYNNEVLSGTVFKQNPSAGDKIRIGDEVDIWIAQSDSLNRRDIEMYDVEEDQTHNDN